MSFYFIVQTFSTTGYGDIPSKLINEYGFRMISIISGVLLYSLFSGQMVNYRSLRIEEEQRFEFKRAALDRIYKTNVLPYHIY